MYSRLVLLLFSAVALATTSFGQGALTKNLRINSDVLGYSLQYRVYTPPGYADLDGLPVMYLTDGQWYIDQGGYVGILDRLIENGEMEPAIAVFIDNRNPDDLSENRRNSQFFCNPDYESFVSDELVPAIDGSFATSAARESRAIMGLSFGGLNAACFALHEQDTFGNVGMQSPATRPVPSMHDDFRRHDAIPIRVFLSSGDRQDNEAQTRRLRDILKTRVDDFGYVEVPFAHNWANWGPLLDDAAVFFFGMD